ncbi:EamA family transporter RarD [Meridianimarinicoccus roseus]|jgi:chloramphenicol-sensitive protein RarD|uniref:EamA family transporter RarD n=1 Tax=Meridianimarinicoccus roseus TaxID=2072018 RepID=A0A2V2L8C9_9RHOB|nr:EamA family transporter RarD [Meridianimarinicoccus roseus]PWR01455.1 EamA family transporter RarD [Meridianimarinicoccus roseus]
MSDGMKGVLAMIGACTIWGLSPLYYKLLSGVPPLEVLSHRTLWSLACFALILHLRGQRGWVGTCLGGRSRLLLTTCAAVAIAANWGLFIFSVQSGFGLEASLGYYIFPLVAVLFGFAFYKDRLRPLQWAAVAVAAVAVGLLTAGLGVVPRLSLLIAVTFGLYGVFKRRLKADPMATVGAEVLVLAPVAVIWLSGVHMAGWTDMTGRPGGVFSHDLSASLLLVLSGPLTGLPLILFSYATQRVILPTIGLIQYLNPTLQVFCAAVIFGETVTQWHAIAFPLIWTGLAIYSLDSVRFARRARRSERLKGL